MKLPRMILFSMVATLLLLSVMSVAAVRNREKGPRHVPATIVLKQAAVPAASEVARGIKAASSAPAFEPAGAQMQITITSMNVRAASGAPAHGPPAGERGPLDLTHAIFNGTEGVIRV
jgi:hypothetical protein